MTAGGGGGGGGAGGGDTGAGGGGNPVILRKLVVWAGRVLDLDCICDDVVYGLWCGVVCWLDSLGGDGGGGRGGETCGL